MSILRLATTLIFFCATLQAQSAYLGFDRNAYPGDANLKALHETFSYTGYWLNHPPGEKINSWTGHRAAVASAGFGFLVLFNGRLYSELRPVAKATRLGHSDAQAAATAARREGFPAHTIIFLDQEQGGRMLPEQKAYIYAWVDAVIAAGFRAGIYCSGVPAADDGNIVTAEDIHQEDIRSNAAGRQIVYWVTNDACPPAPGCAFPQHPPSPAESGVPFAEVWQYAQSPRTDTAAHCTNYNRDGDCFAPGIPAAERLHIDVNSATTSDPSQGR
ncbi:MAG: glycoside hydrolase domain-containing protein [Candidatus Sulfotelmatobacter sp.]